MLSGTENCENDMTQVTSAISKDVCLKRTWDKERKKGEGRRGDNAQSQP